MTQDPLPASGILTINCTAVTSNEIADEFAQFWKPMWMRDARQEQFCGDTWHELDDLLSRTSFPAIPEISHPFHDCDAWIDVVKKCRQVRL